jgi:hypothetical protein
MPQCSMDASPNCAESGRDLDVQTRIAIQGNADQVLLAWGAPEKECMAP